MADTAGFCSDFINKKDSKYLCQKILIWDPGLHFKLWNQTLGKKYWWNDNTCQIFLKVKEVYNFLNFSNFNCIPAELKLKHTFMEDFFSHQTFPIQKWSGLGEYLSQ